MKASAVLPLFCALVLISSSSAFAQWQLNGAPVCTTGGHQYNPTAVSDGAGGVIIAWWTGDIYVQRLDASGTPQWTPNGVPLCTASDTQSFSSIASDGAGGAIVVWDDARNGGGDIYAQRVDASGTPLWTTDGITLCTAAGYRRNPAIMSSAGGVIVAWEEARPSNLDIYAQMVDAFGMLQWGTDGVPVCVASSDQGDAELVSDGLGGAIVVWQDFRNIGLSGDIYAQRVAPPGITQWTSNGVAVCSIAYSQSFPVLVSDALGGAIIAWWDLRSTEGIYAQRVLGSGALWWTSNGILLSTAAAEPYPAIAPDNAGGAIVVWSERRSGNPDIYTQRLNALGASLWTPGGVAIATTAAETDPTIAPDDAGGAIIAWQRFDVYAQRVDAEGVPEWTADGVAVCTATDNQIAPKIVSDGAGGAIVAWQDRRAGAYDVYAQRVEGLYGAWGRPEPTITSIADVSDDNGGNVTITWAAGDRDALNLGTITHYLIWRLPAVTSASAEYLRQPSDAWELVGNQPVLGLPSYSLAVATPEDSTSDGSADYFFQIWSSTADALVFWPSNVVTGHSVDNTAPAAPVSLTAQRVGGDVELTWTSVADSDLSDYVIYRAAASGVTPVPVNFLAYSIDTAYVDAAAPASELYYVVIARDVHENEGAPSNEASVSTVTGIGDTPAITALTVLQNHPNPFTGTTDLEIGLAADADVRVEIFDVTGRRVSSIDVSGVKAGWQRIPFSGRDDREQPLASGVYLYRVSANGQVVTRKMVLAR